jgi:asparagine synthase (glutamine-hydrolysing)
VVSLLRRAKRNEAVDLFLEQQRALIPRRLFRGSVAQQLERATADGVHEELAGIHASDPGRSFHLFLMLNDQRRHLFDHFENIDLHRLEYHLPFFDSRFLELIVSVPLDMCLGHGFYSRWLASFPPVVRQVPWQTYPGHEPCPLPVPPELGYQWEKGVSTLTAAGVRKRSRLADGRATLAAADFPTPVLRKRYLAFAYWMYRLGIRDYGYVLDYAAMVHDHWRRSGGNYVLGTMT